MAHLQQNETIQVFYEKQTEKSVLYLDLKVLVQKITNHALEGIIK